ncbi:polysaccharide pyruvyl transferase family protein [Mesorhizobium sp. AaZ16]|uniref:polysaccharide pyruvyl transferase family protein n=1 Tax=Mesorhizobium sp. AaZ16 TaxID=3402289 RepID=UPI00374EFA17
MLGKSTAVVNGTIPSYDAERGTFLRDLFPLTGAVAGRDRFSAEAYGVRYIPDAGLLYQPPRFDEQRNACLITTGARNSVEDDRDICVKALAVCKEQRLRPIVLTRASSHFSDFVPEIRRMNGIFAETASLPVAAETLSQCSLHIGGRYHMAMLSLLCGVPSLLFDVKTGKNKWLSELSPLIRLVDGDGPLSQAAAEMLSQPKHEPPSRRDLAAEYANFMEEACRSAGGEQATAVQALLNRTGVIA